MHLLHLRASAGAFRNPAGALWSNTLLNPWSCSPGEVELRVQVTAFHFQFALPSQNAPQPVLDSFTPLENIVAVLNGDITYTGCGRCGTELDTDANAIYVPCYRCLPHTAVRCYYRYE